MLLYNLSLDTNGCFLLPPDVSATLTTEGKVIATLGAKFNLTPTATSCVPLNTIFLWSLRYFEELQTQFLALPPADRPPLLAQRIFDTPLYLKTVEGQLCLPASLRDDALISSGILLRGNNGRYELWNPNAFQCRIRR